MRNLASSLRPSRAKMRGGGEAGGGGAQGSRLEWRVFQQSLSLTLTSLDTLAGVYYRPLVSLQFGTLAKFCRKLGHTYKISQHFATLDSVRRQPGWPRLACSLLEITFQNLTFNFAKSKNTPIMEEKVMLIWVQSCQSHYSRHNLTFSRPRSHNKCIALYPWLLPSVRSITREFPEPLTQLHSCSSCSWLIANLTL